MASSQFGTTPGTTPGPLIHPANLPVTSSPGFSFGNPASGGDASAAPAFSFGSKAPTAPSFSFGAKAPATTAPSFSFNGGQTSPERNPRPAAPQNFSFSAPAVAAPSSSDSTPTKGSASAGAAAARGGRNSPLVDLFQRTLAQSLAAKEASADSPIKANWSPLPAPLDKISAGDTVAVLAPPKGFQDVLKPLQSLSGHLIFPDSPRFRRGTVLRSEPGFLIVDTIFDKVGPVEQAIPTDPSHSAYQVLEMDRAKRIFIKTPAKILTLFVDLSTSVREVKQRIEAKEHLKESTFDLSLTDPSKSTNAAPLEEKVRMSDINDMNQVILDAHTNMSTNAKSPKETTLYFVTKAATPVNFPTVADTTNRSIRKLAPETHAPASATSSVAAPAFGTTAFAPPADAQSKTSSSVALATPGGAAIGTTKNGPFPAPTTSGSLNFCPPTPTLDQQQKGQSKACKFFTEKGWCKFGKKCNCFDGTPGHNTNSSGRGVTRPIGRRAGRRIIRARRPEAEGRGGVCRPCRC